MCTSHTPSHGPAAGNNDERMQDPLDSNAAATMMNRMQESTAATTAAMLNSEANAVRIGRTEASEYKCHDRLQYRVMFADTANSP